jgi:type I restriction enzyme S subunit
MRRYEQYKDSGVEWIGEIPVGWEVKRLKYLLKEPLKYGANESATQENHEHPRYIRITDFGNDGKLRGNTFKSLSPEKAEEYLLSKGDILFARSGATVGKTFQFKDYTGIACFAGYLIKASVNSKRVHSDFLYLFTQSHSYEEWKNSVFNQATIQNIGADKYSVLEVLLPPFPEQTAIANYLDQKTAEIDTLIADKKRLLDLYEEEKTAIINQAVTKGLNPDAPMQDSGIEWLGEVPVGWAVTRINRIIKVKDGTHETPNYLPPYHYNYPLVTSKDFKNGDIDFNDSKYISKTDHDKIIKRSDTEKGDILMSMIGGNIGNMVLVSTDRPFSIKNVCLFKTSYNETIAKHLYYILKSSLLKIQIELNSRGGAQGFLSLDDLRNLVYFIVQDSELQAIVHHIETETTRLDAKIERTQQLIALLAEYRVALISEVVTGQVKVV